MHDGKLMGFAREVQAPENVWLMLHGNAGQAADRVYALGAFSPRDSVFIMEYPGYGQRAGKPSRSSLDAAAREAYEALRARFKETPVCVVAESIGSGPAATLGALKQPPDKLVFIVPFDRPEVRGQGSRELRASRSAARQLLEQRGITRELPRSHGCVRRAAGCRHPCAACAGTGGKPGTGQVSPDRWWSQRLVSTAAESSDPQSLTQSRSSYAASPPITHSSQARCASCFATIPSPPLPPAS